MATNTNVRALGVRVPVKLIKQLKLMAVNEDKSLSEIIVPVLENLVAVKLN